MFLINCVLVLNWIVWNRTVYLYKIGFGFKQQMLILHKTKPNQTKPDQTKQKPGWVIYIQSFASSCFFHGKIETDTKQPNKAEPPPLSPG